VDCIPPERTHEVCYLNVADTERPVGFNPLAGIPVERRALAASGIVSAFNRARQGGFARRYGWDFEINELVAYVGMRRKADPNKTYLLRLTFDDFPKRAPSYQFVDLETKERKLEAWPPWTSQSH